MENEADDRDGCCMRRSPNGGGRWNARPTDECDGSCSMLGADEIGKSLQAQSSLRRALLSATFGDYRAEEATGEMPIVHRGWQAVRGQAGRWLQLL